MMPWLYWPKDRRANFVLPIDWTEEFRRRMWPIF